jgi:membrane fusion protein (multidrug efflux system)
VDRGAELATLASPELRTIQRTVELALRSLQQATIEVATARARHAESERHLPRAQAFEQAARARLDQLLALNAEGNTLTARETIDARRSVTEASKARLDAAVARDDLATRVATRQLDADQARLLVAERLGELALLTGLDVKELGNPEDDGAAWRKLQTLTIRAPSTGIVVETLASQGEIVQEGAAILQLFATRELRFRGHLPEGDLGTLAAGNRVRLDFPSRSLQPIEVQLLAPLPVADAATRMIHVEAVVPNEDGALAHGMSVMAQVLVRESQNEEVLIPSRCVVFDGLEAIVFKRDPSNPNVVVRTPVELGTRSAGRIEVLAGVLDGDAIVADGVQQLKQTGLGKAPEGGHFHADGTWHGEHK